MERNPGRRAARVDHKRRTSKIQEVGEPRSNDRLRCADERLVEVTSGLGTNEHPNACAFQRPGIIARVLKSLPAFLKNQALVRVHGLRIARRDVEEQRIETIAVLKDAASVTVGL